MTVISSLEAAFEVESVMAALAIAHQSKISISEKFLSNFGFGTLSICLEFIDKLQHLSIRSKHA
jgi:hypothetical protein